LLPIDLPGVGDALAAIARRTEDATRDLAPATLAAVRRRLENLPHAGRYLAMLEGAEERDERALGRIFGEELPSGLVLADQPPVPLSAPGARDQNADRH
jgi:hypothetical protein